MASGPTAGRRHRRRLLEITFVVGSFVAAGLVAAGVVAGADQPSIASDRSDYAPGDTVVLSGSGWAADETVHVVVDDDQSDAWSHEADVVAAADGTVSDSFDLPELAGTFAVTATATSGSASASFTVTAPTPPPPAPTGTPTLDSDEETYAPGDTVTLTGSDWQAGDTVHVAVNDDGSDAWDHSADVTVAADGTLTDTFDLPDGLAAEFTATATDPADRSATATFTAVSAPAGTPTLDSDEETYAPGDTVTLTGSDWQAGDTVHVAVNDDGSDAWDHSATSPSPPTGRSPTRSIFRTASPRSSPPPPPIPPTGAPRRPSPPASARRPSPTSSGSRRERRPMRRRRSSLRRAP